MLTGISKAAVSSPMSYFDLFSNQIKTGQQYKTSDRKPINLPPDKQLNTLIVNVLNDKGEIEELVVDYLGNKLLLTDELIKNMSPMLIKELEKLGKKTFNPESQGNFVDNSKKVNISGNYNFVQDSSNISIDKSDLTFIDESKRIKSESSSHSKVANSTLVSLVNSPGSNINNIWWGTVVDSTDFTGRNSGVIKVTKSKSGKMSEADSSSMTDSEYAEINSSIFSSITSSPKAKIEKCRNSKITRSPESNLSDCRSSSIEDSPSAYGLYSKHIEIANSPKATVRNCQNNPSSFFYFSIFPPVLVSIKNSEGAVINTCQHTKINNSPSLEAFESNNLIVFESPNSHIDFSEQIILRDSPNGKLKKCIMFWAENSEKFSANKALQTYLLNSPETKIENENINYSKSETFFGWLTNWYVWGPVRKQIAIVNSPDTTLTETKAFKSKNKPGLSIINGKVQEANNYQI